MEKNESKEKVSEIKLSELKKIELPKLDLSKYIGAEVKIEDVMVMEGEWGLYIKIITEPIDDLPNSEDKLKATKIFGVYKDKEDQFGWGEETKLGKYLEKKGVTSPGELKGLTVKLQIEVDKKGNDRLSFL
jgi:hypothetical protein